MSIASYLSEHDDRRKKTLVLSPFFSGMEHTRIVMCPVGKVDEALAGPLAKGTFLPEEWGGAGTSYVSDPVLERATVQKDQGPTAMRVFELVYISVDAKGAPSTTYAEIGLKRDNARSDESASVGVIGITFPVLVNELNKTQPVAGGPKVGDFLEASPTWPFPFVCQEIKVDPKMHAGRTFITSIYVANTDRTL